MMAGETVFTVALLAQYSYEYNCTIIVIVVGALVCVPILRYSSLTCNAVKYNCYLFVR